MAIAQTQTEQTSRPIITNSTIRLAWMNRDQSESPVADGAILVQTTGTVCKSTRWSFPPDPATDGAARPVVQKAAARRINGRSARPIDQPGFRGDPMTCHRRPTEFPASLAKLGRLSGLSGL